MVLNWTAETSLLCMRKKTARNLSKCVVKTPLPEEEEETDGVTVGGGETEAETEAVTGTVRMTVEVGETIIADGTAMHREIAAEEEVVAAAAVVTEEVTAVAVVLTPETEAEIDAGKKVSKSPSFIPKLLWNKSTSVAV